MGDADPPFPNERLKLIAGHSILTGISTETPPMFIVHGAADSKVPARNAEDILAALRKAGVESQLHVFPGAEHGFALRGTGPEKEWSTLCAAWLQKIGMLP